MALVAPSILSADFTCLAKDFKWMSDSQVDFVHIDVMDGHYVPNLTLGPPMIKALRPLTDLPFDVHLMIDNPDQTVDAYMEAGADIITVHPRTSHHLHRLIHRIKDRGLKAGLALNPSESPRDLEFILEDLDQVLLMSVNPGFGGQSFIPSTLEKTRILRDMIQAKNLDIQIAVDGGVNAETGKALVEAGAHMLVAGSYIFGSKNRDQALASLRAL
ncbi:MAG: ribulose-phosphate 3-epimerase [Tissierellia bacterium]|nr:ribulose-phosphate 3-epimerase [Tissierellia bacterium]